MKRAGAGQRCRSCGKPVPRREPGGKDVYPFCSERCRLVDLSKWLNEEYRIPGEPVAVDWGGGCDEGEE